MGGRGVWHRGHPQVLEPPLPSKPYTYPQKQAGQSPAPRTNARDVPRELPGSPEWAIPDLLISNQRHLPGAGRGVMTPEQEGSGDRGISGDPIMPRWCF